MRTIPPKASCFCCRIITQCGVRGPFYDVILKCGQTTAAVLLCNNDVHTLYRGYTAVPGKYSKPAVVAVDCSKALATGPEKRGGGSTIFLPQNGQLNLIIL